jgi:hypothetical protein
LVASGRKKKTATIIEILDETVIGVGLSFKNGIIESLTDDEAYRLTSVKCETITETGVVIKNKTCELQTIEAEKYCACY